MSFENDSASEILAQSRPANTNSAEVYAPPANRRAILTKLRVTNTTGTAANASWFVDADGATRDQTTTLMYAESIAANKSADIDFADGLQIGESGGVGVQTGTADALTFTVIGRELDTRTT